MSASGSNLLASREYSCLRHSRRRPSPFANAASRAICASLTSGGATAADADPVHQAVPAERERAETPTGFDGRVDGTAVLARQPRPAGRSAGRRPEADDAQVELSRDVATLPFLRRVLVPARLPPARQVRVSAGSSVAADPAIPRTGCARTVRLFVRAAPRRLRLAFDPSSSRHSGNAAHGRPPLARVACPLFPWGTVRWSRGCRDGGPGTRTAVRSRAFQISARPTVVRGDGRIASVREVGGPDLAVV